MQWVGVLVGAWQLALSPELTDLSTFYTTHVLPRTLAHEATVLHGGAALAAASTAHL
jgi:hypothetical protein